VYFSSDQIMRDFTYSFGCDCLAISK
jgi:hypothetical protein